MGAINESNDSDYRYRAVAERVEVAGAIGKMIADIEYDNFKNAIYDQGEIGRHRASIYGKGWSALRQMGLIEVA